MHHTVCSENNCNKNYIRECARRLKERTKNHIGTDKKSHVLRYSIESGHTEVLEPNLQSIGKGYRYHI